MDRRAFVLSLAAAGAAHAQSKRRILIDADTANEIDDLFAIVRALREPSFEIAALSSAQWHNRISPANTVELSQRMNEDLLRLAARQDIPVPLGSEMIMGKPWGGDEPRDSPAARMIIAEAMATRTGRLPVVSIGATTNVASALKMKPEIRDHISCYLMGGHYEASTGVWNKDEFNVRNDLNAFNYLLNLDGLDLHIMPATTCRHLVFDREAAMKRLNGGGPLAGYLAARWIAHAPESAKWIMWDLALIEAIAKPELAKESKFKTPPENKQREVGVYTSIDARAMEADFWRAAGW